MDQPNAKVSLQKLIFKLDTARCTISGEVWVANLAFEKKVFVRHTTDDWATYTDVPASFVGPITPGTVQESLYQYDLFNFSLVIRPEDLDGRHEGYVDFCVMFECCGQVSVDGNGGKNYRYRIALLKGTPWAPAQVCMMTVNPFTGDVFGTVRVYKKLCFKERVMVRFTQNDWVEQTDMPADLMFNATDTAYYAFKFNTNTDCPAPPPTEQFEVFHYTHKRSTSHRQFPADFYEDLQSICLTDKGDQKATAPYEFAFEYTDLDEELELLRSDHGLREALRSGSFRARPTPRPQPMKRLEGTGELTRPKMVGMALCYFADDREFWDSNDGANYGFTADPVRPPPPPPKTPEPAKDGAIPVENVSVPAN